MNRRKFLSISGMAGLGALGLGLLLPIGTGIRASRGIKAFPVQGVHYTKGEKKLLDKSSFVSLKEAKGVLLSMRKPYKLKNIS